VGSLDNVLRPRPNRDPQQPAPTIDRQSDGVASVMTASMVVRSIMVFLTPDPDPPSEFATARTEEPARMDAPIV